MVNLPRLANRNLIVLYLHLCKQSQLCRWLLGSAFAFSCFLLRSSQRGWMRNKCKHQICDWNMYQFKNKLITPLEIVWKVWATLITAPNQLLGRHLFMFTSPCLLVFGTWSSDHMDMKSCESTGKRFPVFSSGSADTFREGNGLSSPASCAWH